MLRVAYCNFHGDATGRRASSLVAVRGSPWRERKARRTQLAVIVLLQLRNARAGLAVVIAVLTRGSPTAWRRRVGGEANAVQRSSTIDMRKDHRPSVVHEVDQLTLLSGAWRAHRKCVH